MLSPMRNKIGGFPSTFKEPMLQWEGMGKQGRGVKATKESKKNKVMANDAMNIDPRWKRSELRI